MGLLIFAGCHHAPPATKPAPRPPAPERAPAPAIASAASLVRAMHDRYPAWYRTLSFTQKTTINPPTGGELYQTWYEAARLPGRLRIETDVATKSGTLFVDDSVYSFASGKRTRASADMNELLLLGFDVYTQSVARTEAQLRSRGFDLSRFHEGTWQGKPIFVVGAMRGDTSSKQFWVDAENLLFLRLLENSALGHNDIRFENYRQVGNGWIAERVDHYVNGRRRLLEEYSNVRIDEPFPDALFEPRSWATVPRPGAGRRDH
ncbi:MAG TPA: hypothetical protein VH277_17575 [Gemmatimonadaceae bacterium]|nr:hypothetical protein [Gemmatimonadaceae bacterium]